MAIEKIGFDLVNNADEVAKKLQQIDNQIKKLSNAKNTIKIDDKGIASASATIEQLNQQIKELTGQKSEILLDYEDAVGAERAASDLSTALDDVSSSSGSAENSFSRLGSTLSSVGQGLSSVGNTLDNIGSSVLSAINPFDGLTSSVLGQLSAFKLLEKGVESFFNVLESGISRFSILQTSPNVLSALGFSADDIQASNDALTDFVQGIPIKFEDVTNTTKRISTITDDLGLATEATIALNNAFLANGTSTKDITRATEQWLQMLSTGDVDVRSWRTLEESLQIPLKLLSDYFGYGGSRDLYDAIKDDVLTFQDLQNGLIELATGEGELAQLAQINSQNLENSVEVLSNAWTVAGANILEALDDMTQAVTGKKLYELVDGLRAGIKTLEVGVIDWIDSNYPLFDRLFAFFEDVRDRFVSFDWSSFKEGFVEGARGLAEGFQSLVEFFEPVLDWIRNRITDLGDGNFARGLGKLPAELLKFAVRMKAAGKALKLAGAVFQGLGSVLSFLGNKQLAKSGIGRGGSLLGGLGSGEGLLSGSGLSSKITRGAVSLIAVAGAIASLAAAVKLIDVLVPNDLAGLSVKLTELAGITVVFGSFAAIAGEYSSNNSRKAIAGIATLTALAIPIVALSAACLAIDRLVPDDFKGFVGKLGTLTLVVVAFGALATAAGFLAGNNPLHAVAGIASLTALAVPIIALSYACKQIDALVPSDWGSMVEKLGVLATVIGAFSLIVAAIGALEVATGGIGALVAAGGIVTLIGLAYSISKVAEAVADIDRYIPSNTKQIEKKLDSLTELLTLLPGLANPLTAILRLFTVVDLALVVAQIRLLLNIADLMADLNDINVPKGVDDKIQTLYESLEALGRRGLIQTLRDFVTAADLKQVEKVVGSYIDIAELLATLSRVDVDAIQNTTTQVLPTISRALQSLLRSDLKGLIKSWLSSSTVKNLQRELGYYIEISEAFSELHDKFDFVAVSNAAINISTINDVLRQMEQFGIIDLAISGLSASSQSNLARQIDGYIRAVEGFKKLHAEWDFVAVSNARVNISTLNDVLREMEQFGVIDLAISGLSEKSQENLAKQVTGYISAVEELNRLHEVWDYVSVYDAGHIYIPNLNAAFRAMEQFSLGGFLSTLVDVGSTANLVAQLEAYKTAAGKLQELGTYNWVDITNAANVSIGLINHAFEEMKSGYSFWEWIGGNKIDTDVTTNMSEQLGSYKTAAGYLDDIGKLSMTRLSEGTENIAEINNAIEALIKADSEITTDASYAKTATEYISEQVGYYLAIGDNLSELNDIDVDMIDNIVDVILPKIHTLIVKLNGLGLDKTTISWSDTHIAPSNSKQVDNASSASSIAASIQAQVEAYKAIIDAFRFLSPELTQYAIDRTDEIQNLITKITGITLGEFTSEDASEIYAVTQDLTNIVREVQTISNIEVDIGKVESILSAVKALIQGLKTLADLPNTVQILAVLGAIKETLTQLSSFEADFQGLGFNYAENLVFGFVLAKIADRYEAVIKGALSKIERMVTDFKAAGESLGKALVEGFEAQVKTMPDKVSDQITAIGLLTVSMKSTGRNLGNALSEGFGETVIGLASAVSAQISAIQNSLNSLKAPTLSTTLKVSTPSGLGNDPRYRAEGGPIGFAPRGTDTIPAMLSPGEFVQRKSAVDKFGVGFMNRINQLDLPGALKSYYGGMNHHNNIQTPIQSIVNNITNHNIVNHNNVTQHMSGRNQDYNVSRALKHMGAN